MPYHILGPDKNTAELLIYTNSKNTENFKFHTINGCWDGTYSNGTVTCDHPDHKSKQTLAIIYTLNQRESQNIKNYEYGDSDRYKILSEYENQQNLTQNS